MVPLYERLLSALIVEENNTNLYDGPQGDCLHCTSEEIRKQIESDIQKSDDIESRKLDLDQRILLELQSLGIFEEPEPDLEHNGNEETEAEVCQLNEQELQGINAFDCKITRNEGQEEATQDFVEGTLVENIRFEETNKSSFSDAPLKERMFSTSSKDKNKKKLGDAIKANPVVPLEESSHIVAQNTQKLAIETTLPRGATKKRTKRDRGVQAKDIIIRSNSTRSGQSDLAYAKGEMKHKLKPRQKNARISASKKKLLGKPSQPQKPPLASCWKKSSDKTVEGKDEMTALHNSIADDETSDDNTPIDLSHLHIPPSEDIASWLNFEDDSLPYADGDYMGLAIPNDNLDDLNMF